MALALVFGFIVAGCIMLALDYDTTSATWLSIAGAFVCIGTGLILGHVFDRKNLLPE